MGIVTTIAIVIACLSSCVNSFNVPGNIMTQMSFISSSSVMMAAEEDDKEVGAFERGVSIDQDGKSNVWAIEPKVEVDAKSSQEKSTIIYLGVGGLVAFGAIAAFVLTNLPDADQF